MVGIAGPCVTELGMDSLAEFDAGDCRDLLVDFLESDECLLLKAVKDSRVVGGFGGRITASWWNLDIKIAQHVFIAVHPEFRRFGAASMMVEAFERWGAAKGCSRAIYLFPGTSRLGDVVGGQAMETIKMKEIEPCPER